MEKGMDWAVGHENFPPAAETWVDSIGFATGLNSLRKKAWIRTERWKKPLQGLKPALILHHLRPAIQRVP